jgi:two-component system alkaline phosphatase synthesis response regulator PhoP
MAEPLLCFEDSDPTIQLSTGRLRYDPKVMMFFYNFRKLELTPSEFKLLRVLYQNAGQVCAREQCAEAIWEHGYEPDPDNDPLNRVVSNLRQKLKQVDSESDLIETHRGVGYILHL